MIRLCMVVLLAALMTRTALAINVLACEGKSVVMSPGKTLHFKLLLDKKSKEFSVYSNGIKSDDKVTLMTPNLTNLEAYLKCDTYDEACKGQSKGKDEGYEQAAGIIAFSKAMAKDLPKDKNSSLANLKVSDIGKARIYQVGNDTKFGGMGVYEYFDKSGKMMGRYIYALETMDCRNKETPTDDQGKALRKLTKEPAQTQSSGSAK
jgi:hypothetical protein